MRIRSIVGLGAGTLVVAVAAGAFWRSQHAATPMSLAAGLPRPKPALLPAVQPAPAAATKPDPGPYFPFLADEPQDVSVSVGCTSHGVLVNAQPLDCGDTCAVLAAHEERDLHYGTAEMVALLEFAAKRLHEQTGTRLFVGNIAKRGGGDIPYSVSHNSGRDADVAFCYQDRKGKPLDPPTLIPLNSEGLAKRAPYRFDVARTWIVVQALLEYPKAQIQYLFISNSLKRQLIAHAHQISAPAGVVRRAAAVLGQPSAAAAHNDHLHVRTYCSQRDVEGGCTNTGVIHPWAQLFEEEKAARAEQVVAHLDDQSAEQRRRAIERLVLLDGRDEIEPLAARLRDPHEGVRAAAAYALGVLGTPKLVPELIEAYQRETGFATRAALLGAFRTLGGGQAMAFLQRLIASEADRLLSHGTEIWAMAAAGDPRTRPVFALLPATTVIVAAVQAAHPPELAVDWQPGDGPPEDSAAADVALRVLAIDAAGRGESLKPIDALVPLLESPLPVLRARSAAALRLITNRSFGVGWHDPKLDAAWRKRQRRAWQHWIDSHRGQPRDVWLASGFMAAGYRVQRIHQKHLWELVRAVGGAHELLSYNAQRALMRLTNHQPPSLEWSRPEACRYWLKWLRARRKTYRIGPPPKKLERRCS